MVTDRNLCYNWEKKKGMKEYRRRKRDNMETRYPKTAFTVSAGFKCLELFYKQSVDLYLCYCGIEDCSPGHSFGPASRNDFLIHYVTRGKGIYQVGNRQYKIEAGGYFLICPDVTTFYQADLEEPWSYLWIGFNGMKAASYLEYLHLNQTDKLTGKCDSMEFLTSCVKEMLKARELTHANELKREAQLYLFLAELAASSKTEERMSEEAYDYPAQVYAEHALQYMEEHYSEGIRVGDIADFVGLNRSYLTNCFKRTLGESPQEYLIRLRVEKAEELLKKTKDSIAVIAGAVGYKDPMTFSRVFKREKGISPKEYRQEGDVQIENRW